MSPRGEALLRWAWRRLGRALPDRFFVVAKYRYRHGRFPDLETPRRFTEKVTRRILVDRDQRLVGWTDKVEAKRLAGLIDPTFVTPALLVTADPAAVPWRDLPLPCVVKTNHGCGMNLFLRTAADLAPARHGRLLRRWLATDYTTVSREWPYRHVPPRILVEPWLTGPGGGAPVEYKLWVFGGRVELIRLIVGEPARRGAVYDRDWRRVDLRFAVPPLPADPQPPPELDRMIAFAERLGAEFDFVRVDLYDTDSGPRFGEATFFPDAGMAVFEPAGWDERLGDLWPQLG